MAGLDPAIHLSKMMDARVKPAHDPGCHEAIALLRHLPENGERP
jgi:hypothetical protein